MILGEWEWEYALYSKPRASGDDPLGVQGGQAALQ